MMESFIELGYFGLFAAAFLAATVLPLSSEIVFVTLLLSGFTPPIVIVIATIGNVIGSLTNYLLGYWLGVGRVQKWLRVSEEEFTQAKNRYQKYGMISLCFAWVPIIGDPLTVVAGVLKVPLPWFIVLVTTGKLARYAVLSYLTLHVV